MTTILTFVFAFLIFYNLFKWLGATRDRRRQYRYADSGSWIVVWAACFAMTDWVSPADAAADTSEAIEPINSGDEGGGSGCGGCGGCGG